MRASQQVDEGGSPHLAITHVHTYSYTLTLLNMFSQQSQELVEDPVARRQHTQKPTIMRVRVYQDVVSRDRRLKVQP